MPIQGVTIERLTPPVSDADVSALARLLVNTVESGAAVSFVLPLSQARAEEWWRATLNSAHPRAIFLVARESGRIIGTVQLHPAWAPNQPHRAEIVKLMVDNSCHSKGIGTRLMQAIEDAARGAGLTLLTLDAKRGGAAERLYKRMGWIEVGIIPDFAVDPDGKALHDTVIFYKRI